MLMPWNARQVGYANLSRDGFTRGDRIVTHMGKVIWSPLKVYIPAYHIAMRNTQEKGRREGRGGEGEGGRGRGGAHSGTSQ